MAKQSRGKSSSFGSKSGKRTRRADTGPDNQVIDIHSFSQRKSSPRIPVCHSPLIQARNQAQGHYLAAIKTHQLTFVLPLALWRAVSPCYDRHLTVWREVTGSGWEDRFSVASDVLATDKRSFALGHQVDRLAGVPSG